MALGVEWLAVGVRTGVLSDTLADLVIIVAAVVIVSEFVVSLSYAVDVLSGVVAVAPVNALVAGIIGFVSDIGVKVMADVGASVFAAVTTALEFAVSIPLEVFGCCASFDCCPLAVFNCDRVLQTCMPSYHV